MSIWSILHQCFPLTGQDSWQPGCGGAGPPCTGGLVTASLTNGCMAVVSGVATVNRLTQQLATERNALVARLAHKIVVAHASPAGSLAAQLEQWRLDGRQVELL